jgi:CD2 antigen cytoplasmic tail-binding protein 2
MSTKRKVTFAEEDESRLPKVMKMESLPGKIDAVQEAQHVKGKHSLDSDEEDVVDDSDGLKLDDIEGQEESKVDIEDGIRFTPFNLKEEYEEGEFDADGMYIFNKNKNQIKDNWIDDIDWAKVKQAEHTKTEKVDKLVSDELPESINVIAVYRTMLKLMKPGETVARAIKRLGGAKTDGSSGSTVRRNKQLWKTKKTKAADSNMEVDSVSESNVTEDLSSSLKRPTKSRIEPGKEDLLELIGCADNLLSLNGEMEIYQETYERLNYKVQTTAVELAATQPIDTGLDIFADDTPVSNVTTLNKSVTDELTTQTNDSVKSEGDVASVTTQIMWEYKWQNTDTAEIHGPFSSSEMLQWTKDDYFPDGVFVRKVSTAPSGEFYSSRRIDFELYI